MYPVYFAFEFGYAAMRLCGYAAMRLCRYPSHQNTSKYNRSAEKCLDLVNAGPRSQNKRMPKLNTVTDVIVKKAHLGTNHY